MALGLMLFCTRSGTRINRTCCKHRPTRSEQRWKGEEKLALPIARKGYCVLPSYLCYSSVRFQ
jgi:hypothetical protein